MSVATVTSSSHSPLLRFKYNTKDFSDCHLSDIQTLKPYINFVYSRVLDSKTTGAYQSNLALLTAVEKTAINYEDLYLSAPEALYLLTQDLFSKTTPESKLYKGLRCAFISSLFRLIIKTGSQSKESTDCEAVRLMQRFSISWIQSLLKSVMEGRLESATFVWGDVGHCSILDISREVEGLKAKVFDPVITTMESKPEFLAPIMSTSLTGESCLSIAETLVLSWTKSQAHYLSKLAEYGFNLDERSPPVTSELSKLNCTLAAPLAWIENKDKESFASLLPA